MVDHSYLYTKAIDMKLLIIRHAEPDYEHDSLTPRGVIEAEALRDYLKDKRIDKVYSSPYGRAFLTAKISLEGKSLDIKVLDFLHEFNNYVDQPLNPYNHYCWDFYPEYFTTQKEFYDRDASLKHPLSVEFGLDKQYKLVSEGLDEILKENGYERCGGYYAAVKPNDNVIAIYCHLGTMGILMSHLTGIPYLLINQHFAVAPSGVTVINTEERHKGIAQWRISRYGDVSHLILKGLEPSFHARFCEQFTDDTRHE